MQKYPLAFYTVAWGDASKKEARTCEASFRYWHPDIPFICIDEDDYLHLTEGIPPAWSSEIVSIRALAGWFLSRRIERVVCVDSDLYFLGRLDGLLNCQAPTFWTADYSAFTMGVPEMPRINSGLVGSSYPVFWQTWVGAQYGCLLPALDQYYFDQFSLRALALSGAVKGEMLDGQPGSPYYNISIREQPGDWHIEDDKVYKGCERALIYHQAGYSKRGIGEAPLPLQPHLLNLTSPEHLEIGAKIDLESLWQDEAADFLSTLKENFQKWPTITLDLIMAQFYARTPNQYRTVTPRALDKLRNLEGTPWQRVWNPKWQAYLYYRK